MLGEITAVTQLLLVIQVGYLMHHCRSFKNGIPPVLETIEDRDRRNLENQVHVLTLLDDIADGIHGGDSPEAHAPFDLKALLTSVLLSRFNTQPEHGGTESEGTSGTIHEINEATQVETEL